MKAKTIKAVLRKKFDAWIDSIEDMDVKKLAQENSIITGGSIVSMLLNEKVSDYDIYFANVETVEAVANYYVRQFIKLNCDEWNAGRIKVVVADEERLAAMDGCAVCGLKGQCAKKEELESCLLLRDGWGCPDDCPEFKEGMTCELPNGNNEPCPLGVTLDYNAADHPNSRPRVKIFIKSQGILSEENFEDMPDAEGEVIDREQVGLDPKPEAEKKPSYRPVFISSNAITLSDKVQVVIRFWGEPEEIHSNYDFEHCKCWWRSSDGRLDLPQAALEAILARELVYTGSKYPLCSIFRTRKFIRRGWQVNAGQMLKMALQLNELNLLDPKVLEEQLTGVDAAYFNQVINSVLKRQKEDPEFKISTGYLWEVINRIF